MNNDGLFSRMILLRNELVIWSTRFRTFLGEKIKGQRNRKAKRGRKKMSENLVPRVTTEPARWRRSKDTGSKSRKEKLLGGIMNLKKKVKTLD